MVISSLLHYLSLKLIYADCLPMQQAIERLLNHHERIPHLLRNS